MRRMVWLNTQVIARITMGTPREYVEKQLEKGKDVILEIEIQGALKKLSEGRTTVVVAHRLSTVKNADEIIVMTADGVKERGTHEELLALGGGYKELYNFQFKEG